MKRLFVNEVSSLRIKRKHHLNFYFCAPKKKKKKEYVLREEISLL